MIGPTNELIVGASAGQVSAGVVTGLGTIASQNANAVAITGGAITGLGTPTSPTDASTKGYVDNLIASVNPAVTVNAATTGVGIAGTYNNGVAGVGATFTPTATGALVIDGQTLLLGQRVLLKDQGTTNGSTFQNGVYLVTLAGSTGVSAILTRALDYNTATNINNTGAIPVTSGTINGSTTWVINSAITTVGTDALTFSQFTRAPNTVQSGTYANKPSPVLGLQYFATDIGTRGVLLISDGTLWKPAGGIATIYFDNVAHTAAGTGAEQNITFATIPAGLVSANGAIRVFGQLTATGVNGTKTLIWRLSSTSGGVNGTQILNGTNGGSATTIYANAIKFIQNNNSQASQIISPTGASGVGIQSTGGLINTTINFANTVYINFNITAASASDTVGYQGILIEWIEP